jgi:hypothetical protein
MNFLLPEQSHVHKFIPKSKFFEKAVVSTKLKKEFTDKIQKIIWQYKLAEDTIGVPMTKKVEEIQIFEIQLKEREIPKNVLKLIDKSIPYPILYFFTHEGHIAYGITLKGEGEQRYYFSSWDDKMIFNFVSTDLERVYQGMVTTFIKKVATENKDFKVIIEVDKKVETIEKEISAMKNKIKNERQFNRKVELNKKLQSKIAELSKLNL